MSLINIIILVYLSFFQSKVFSSSFPCQENDEIFIPDFYKIIKNSELKNKDSIVEQLENFDYKIKKTKIISFCKEKGLTSLSNVDQKNLEELLLDFQSKTVLNCNRDLKDIYIPTIYEWIRSKKRGNDSHIIELLEKISFEEKIIRLGKFCKENSYPVISINKTQQVDLVVDYLLGENKYIYSNQSYIDCFKSFDFNELYQKIQNHKKIKILKEIPDEEKINRIKKFCLKNNIDKFSYLDKDLFFKLIENILYKNQSEERNKPHPIKNFNPDLIEETSFVYQQKIRDKKVFLVKRRKAPLQWQELCLSRNKYSVNFSDCFSSTDTQLNILFKKGSNEFRLIHEDNKCLSNVDNRMEWVNCNETDENQYFVRVNYNESSDEEFNYLKFKIKNINSEKFISENGSFTDLGDFFYFRDVFPLIEIPKPIDYIPKKEIFDSFLSETHFSSVKKNNIIIIWIDTTRSDLATADVMPNLTNFKNKSISFEKTFAGGTATRASGFTLWNSRPSTEWKYFSSGKYHKEESNSAHPSKDSITEEGHLNLRILDKLGYEVHAFASELPVIDENLFFGNSSFAMDEKEYFSKKYNDKIFGHRLVFDFHKEIKNRSFKLEHSFNLNEYRKIRRIDRDKKISEFFLEELKNKSDQPKASLIWLTGSHTPYLTLDEVSENLKRYPSFNPYPHDDYTKILEPLWINWFYENQKLRTGPFGRKSIINSYLNSASSSDYVLGQILKGLETNKTFEDSIVIVLSDHGESLFENNYLGHGGPTLQKVIDVPLYYHFPEDVSSHIKTKVGAHQDVFPTIFDYLGLKITNSFNGLQLKDMIKGQSIFSDGNTCQMSGEPNGYQYPTTEFAIFNDNEKIRARFRTKETVQNLYSKKNNPLTSEKIEIISYTDYWDNPLDTGSNSDEVSRLIHQKFDKCFQKYFGRN